MNQGAEQNVRIKLGNYFIYKLIGRGATSHVYEAYDTLNDRKVAIKKISKIQLFESGNQNGRLRLLSYVQNEKAILLNCKHNRETHPLQSKQTHIIEILDSITTKDAYYIVLEFCESSLRNLIEENKKNQRFMDEQEAILKLLQIFHGVQVLHENCICHRDLKPDNTLLKLTQQGLEIKISDFGFGKFLNGERIEDFVGTPGYAAPEITRRLQDGRRKKYNPIIADMYSLGVMFYEMLFNERPKEVITFQRNPQLSKNVQEVLTQMLDPDPEKRIKWEQLNDNLFLQKAFDYSQELNEYFFKKWKNKINLLDGTIIMIDHFRTENNSILDHDMVILQLQKKKYVEIQKKIKQQEEKANLMDQKHLQLNKVQRDQAKQACKNQIETMLSYDYLMIEELVQPRPGQSMIMCQTNNRNNNGNEAFMKTDDFNFECHPHRYINILQKYIEELEQIKPTKQTDVIQYKKILSLQFQIKLASDFDNDFVNVVEENQQERIDLLLQRSQPNVNNFEQLFSTVTLQCGNMYFDQTNIKKTFESQVILQQQN